MIVSQFLRYFSWRIQCLFLTSASLFGTTPRVTGSSWTHSGLTGKKEKRRMHKIWAKRDGISLCNQGCRSRSAQQGGHSPPRFRQIRGGGNYAPSPPNFQTFPPALASHCPLLALQQASLFNIESKFQKIINVTQATKIWFFLIQVLVIAYCYLTAAHTYINFK